MSITSLLQMASKFRKTASLGQNELYEQVDKLNNSAHMLRLVSPIFEQAALGDYNSDDIYEEDTEAPTRVAKVKLAISEINEITSRMRGNLSTQDINKLAALIETLEKVQKDGEPNRMMMSALTKFRTNLNNLSAAVDSTKTQSHINYQDDILSELYD